MEEALKEGWISEQLHARAKRELKKQSVSLSNEMSDY
jgi:hypothetical protein